MALSLVQAKSLLSGIVGKNTTRYLGLSSTEPQPVSSGTLPSTGVTFTNYNITEPTTATSYTRIQISSSEFANDAAGDYLGATYVTTIKNSKEIHFTEAIQDWGFYKYFFITTTAASRSYPADSVVYVGELIYDKFVGETSYTATDYEVAGDAIRKTIFDGTATTSANFASRKDYLYVLEGENYVVCSDKEFDAEATYFVQGLGIHIEANTVPLVRANLLKISVQ